MSVNEQVFCPECQSLHVAGAVMNHPDDSRIKLSSERSGIYRIDWGPVDDYAEGKLVLVIPLEEAAYLAGWISAKGPESGSRVSSFMYDLLDANPWSISGQS